MNREYRVIHSETLGHPMEMIVFGHSGKPMLVFPSQEGRFFDYENFGMPETISNFIEEGKIQLYCVDSIDNESWFNKEASPEYRAKRALDYERIIVEDVVPHIYADGHEGAGIIAHGCSFGAFHTANFFLKYPEIFDLGIALSGCYDIGFTMNGFWNDDAEAGNPLSYSSHLSYNKIQKLQDNLLIICSGQGPWEEWTGEAIELAKNLKEVDIPVFLDLWGYDVAHDWPWWKKQIVYFLEKFDRSGFLKSKHRMTADESQYFLQNFYDV